ncbi:MAG TPA: hypothetical protein VE010_11335, partial [Thermoanaerobaculia bacterium]|nr:hypothetical protein [Thermoanaerobaculia bacterium]
NRAFVVNVANPVSYIAQKLIVMPTRSAKDRAKDLLYIHDTVELYGARLHELHRLWTEIIRPHIGTDTHVVTSQLRKYFNGTNDDVRRAALVAGGRNLKPETLRLRCEMALDQVFADKAGD